MPGKGKDPAAAPRENSAWEQGLKGRHLLFLETAGGGTRKAVINLDANGQFVFKSSSSYASCGSADFSYADQDMDIGTWRIEERQGAVLLVTVSSERARLRDAPAAQCNTHPDIA